MLFFTSAILVEKIGIAELPTQFKLTTIVFIAMMATTANLAQELNHK